MSVWHADMTYSIRDSFNCITQKEKQMTSQERCENCEEKPKPGSTRLCARKSMRIKLVYISKKVVQNAN